MSTFIKLPYGRPLGKHVFKIITIRGTVKGLIHMCMESITLRRIRVIGKDAQSAVCKVRWPFAHLHLSNTQSIYDTYTSLPFCALIIYEEMYEEMMKLHFF